MVELRVMNRSWACAMPVRKTDKNKTAMRVTGVRLPLMIISGLIEQFAATIAMYTAVIFIISAFIEMTVDYGPIFQYLLKYENTERRGGTSRARTR